PGILAPSGESSDVAFWFHAVVLSAGWSLCGRSLLPSDLRQRESAGSVIGELTRAADSLDGAGVALPDGLALMTTKRSVDADAALRMNPPRRGIVEIDGRYSSVNQW